MLRITCDGVNDLLMFMKEGELIPVAKIIWNCDAAVLDCLQPKEGIILALLPIRATTKNVEFALMHRRLGHAGKDRAIEACKKSGNKISGNKMDEDTVKDFHCRVCHLAKFEAIISRTPLVAATEFLQFVFWDITEHPPIGYGGKRYSLHGIDFWSRYLISHGTSRHHTHSILRPI